MAVKKMDAKTKAKVIRRVSKSKRAFEMRRAQITVSSMLERWKAMGHDGSMYLTIGFIRRELDNMADGK